MRLNVTSILFALSLILGIQPLTAQVVDPALAGMSQNGWTVIPITYSKN